MPIFETARLTFREMGLADRDFGGSMLSDPEVTRFYPEELRRAGAEPWIERQLMGAFFLVNVTLARPASWPGKGRVAAIVLPFLVRIVLGP
jgi:RimJ/RimL family protein N-acetyltransferase